MKKIKWLISFCVFCIGGREYALEAQDYKSLLVGHLHRDYQVVEIVDSDINSSLYGAIVMLGHHIDRPEKLIVCVLSKSELQKFVEIEIPFSRAQESATKGQIHILKGKNGNDYVSILDSQRFSVFLIEHSTLKKEMDFPLEKIEFLPTKNNVEKIRGLEVFSFCDGCDTTSEAELKDVFQIPVEISILDGLFKTKCLLTELQIAQLKKEFKKRKKIDRRRAFWSGPLYSKFLEKLEREFSQALEK